MTGSVARGPGAARFDAADITRFYDRHSASFVRYGQGGAAIHRAVWGPGTRTRDDAFHYVDDQIGVLVGRFVATSDEVHVVDLGCGVGASLCRLVSRLPIRGTGITLSPTQAAMARQVVAGAGFSDRIECLQGDYCALPASIMPADVAYAIESFVHGPAPERFFDQCHRLIKPGGLLVICDDVVIHDNVVIHDDVVIYDDVRKRGAPLNVASSIEAFMRGWHINTLVDRETLIRLARDAGFEHESTTDLTPLLEIHRMRDRAIAAGVRLLRWLSPAHDRFDYMVGGHALQTCLAKGWIGYELSVFRSAKFG
jgi:SAM-dependent methyltransferase